jgi:hypothetical protein
LLAIPLVWQIAAVEQNTRIAPNEVLEQDIKSAGRDGVAFRRSMPGPKSEETLRRIVREEMREAG